MNKPDKIYVSRNFSEDNSPHGLWYLNKSEHDVNVEYISKDALLEWAKENHKRMVDVHSDYTKIYDEYFRGLIEKIESL